MEELDELTLARVKRGDPIAQTRLVELYQAKVWALLGRMLGRRSPVIEDLAQETFLRALGAIGTFDPRGKARLSTWILTIATRLAIDAMRGQRRWQPEEAAEERVDRDALERLEQRELAVQVEASLATLAPEARAILVLRAHEDLDYPEIADALGLEAGTVKSRLSRARAALRAALAARGVELGA